MAKFDPSKLKVKEKHREHGVDMVVYRYNGILLMTETDGDGYHALTVTEGSFDKATIKAMLSHFGFVKDMPVSVNRFPEGTGYNGVIYRQWTLRSREKL